MFSRVSVNVILKSVIAIRAAAVVVVLAQGAWTSWTRLKTANRIASVADISMRLFTGLHNLRSDRARSYRALVADEQISAQEPRLWLARNAAMPALKSALAALEAAPDFPERQAMASALAQKIKTLTALHEQSAAAVAQPKAARPPRLAVEIRDEITDFLAMLDRMSLQLNALVNLDDAFVDQLIELKQLAWMGRDAGGEDSLLLWNTLGGDPLPPDAMLKYTAYIAKLDAAWAVLERQAAALPLPPRFKDAVAQVKTGLFAPDFVELRLSIMKKLIAGEPAPLDFPRWSTLTVEKLATLLNVAEVALDVAKEHAAAQRASAARMLAVQLALLALAVVFTAGMFVVVSRRVTGPLNRIREAMIKLAGGDFGVVVPGLERKDEIGAMANAVER